MALRKDQIMETIKREILMLTLAPGMPLDEASLSAQFQISRTPLRDILQRLAGEGYVIITQNKGAMVAPMDPKSMRNFFMTAPMIYATISRLAAQNATTKDIARLSETQRHFKEAVKAQSVEQLVYYNDQFHYQIGEMADNDYLMPSLQRLLMEHARIGQTFWQSDNQTQSHAIQEAARHHDAFIDIFAAHDEEEAVRLTLDHWALSKANMDDYIRPTPLASDIILAG